MALKSFRELLVWQRAMELVVAVYQLTSRFPKQEAYGLRKQMERAAVSIPSNIAEGYGRKHRSEYLHFLSIARGSMQELDTQLEIAARIGVTTREAEADCLVLIDETGKMLWSLSQSLASP